MIALTLTTMFLTCVPASADYIGYYQSIAFYNNTDYCVWYTIYRGVPGQDGLQNIRAINVPPHSRSTYPPVPNAWWATEIRIRIEAYTQGNCTGTTVAERVITKTASSPRDSDVGPSLAFGAVAQLDIGGGHWNLYWGADKFNGTTNYRFPINL
jgi:hypothetical protein